MDLNDSVLEHLRHVAALPDLSATRYVLECELGRGGLGVVYQVYDPALDRRTALKVTEAPLSGEARVIAQLEHPAIVPVYDTGVLPDGRAFYTMKLIAGARLDVYAEGTASLGARLEVIRRVGEALSFAHSRGVLHRDLKPQNIMVGEFGEVYVMDWGVEGVAGTAAFRAPEAHLDSRSDIYSLGAVLRFLTPARSSPALDAIATKATTSDPSLRYAAVADLLRDLERFQEGSAVEAWREPVWHRAKRFASRNAVLLWLLAAYTAVRFLLFFLRSH